jgi:hypothetical protein
MMRRMTSQTKEVLPSDELECCCSTTRCVVDAHALELRVAIRAGKPVTTAHLAG